MEKSVVPKEDVLTLTTDVLFVIPNIKARAFVNTGNKENIIFVDEILSMGPLLYMKAFGDPNPLIMQGFKAVSDGFDNYYESNLEVEINGKKESHVFEFRVFPNPDYPVILGLDAIRGRTIETK